MEPTALGRWGSILSQNFICVHLNHIIKAHSLDIIYDLGTCHGGLSVISNTDLERTDSEVYLNTSSDQTS